MNDITTLTYQTPKKKRLSKKARDYIFIVIMLFYPVLQFLVTWIFVNINSLMHAFQVGTISGEYKWVGFDNFVTIIKDFFNNSINTTGVSWLNNTSVIVLNSLGFAFVTIFISLPLSLLFSYFLSKKMPLCNVFRAIFFLPNIIPVVALAFAFTTSFDSTFGYLYDFMRWLGFKDNFLSVYPTSQIMVYIYCIWAGLGYNIVLLSGAIGRIPKELFESAELDHAGYFKEFIHVVIPCIWPTIVTLIVLGMTNVLTLYLQPLLITNGEGNTYTISLDIFLATKSYSPAQYCTAAAKGLLCSALWAPIILVVRHFLSKKYSEVDY
ncbi:MAG: carbohydrate ABC transporter permease [Bacilli bacterium]